MNLYASIRLGVRSIDHRYVEESIQFLRSRYLQLALKSTLDYQRIKDLESFNRKKTARVG